MKENGASRVPYVYYGTVTCFIYFVHVPESLLMLSTFLTLILERSDHEKTCLWEVYFFLCANNLGFLMAPVETYAKKKPQKT